MHHDEGVSQDGSAIHEEQQGFTEQDQGTAVSSSAEPLSDEGLTNEASGRDHATTSPPESSAHLDAEATAESDVEKPVTEPDIVDIVQLLETKLPPPSSGMADSIDAPEIPDEE